jgi:hypothetical protein
VKYAILLAVLLTPLGCGPKVPVLPGLINELAAFDGWYTPDGTQRVSFKGGREDGQAICKIILAGTPCDTVKGQARGSLTLTFAGPKTQVVELASVLPVVVMDGQSFVVRMDELMAILERVAKSGN